MSSILWNSTAVLLVFSGFTALCLTIKRHYADIYGRGEAGPALRRALALGGWLALAAALWIFIVREGFGNGVMLWFGSLTGSGWLLVLMLNYASKRVIPAATGSAGLTLLLMCMALISS